jgi:hypothetical protein
MRFLRLAVPTMTLAAMSALAPAFAAAASAETAQAAPGVVRAAGQPGHIATSLSARRGDGSDDVSGLEDESPVCSALGSETVPTGDVVGQCLVGTRLI